jgi:hypothetical protein
MPRYGQYEIGRVTAARSDCEIAYVDMVDLTMRSLDCGFSTAYYTFCPRHILIGKGYPECFMHAFLKPAGDSLQIN